MATRSGLQRKEGPSERVHIVQRKDGLRREKVRVGSLECEYLVFTPQASKGTDGLCDVGLPYWKKVLNQMINLLVWLFQNLIESTATIGASSSS